MWFPRNITGIGIFIFYGLDVNSYLPSKNIDKEDAIIAFDTSILEIIVYFMLTKQMYQQKCDLQYFIEYLY